MSQMIVGAVGAVVGFVATGFNPAGAAWGWSIGSAIGAQMDGGPEVYGPRLANLRAPRMQYGTKFPRIYGRARVSGFPAWQSDLREVATTTEQGKGGPSAQSTTYTYYRDVIYVLADETNVVGITRVWRNGELIYSILADAEAETIDASLTSEAWTELRFYDGNEDQLPDPVYEAALGTSIAIGWRWRATVMLENVNQGGFEMLPHFEFEIYTEGEEEPEPVVSGPLFELDGPSGTGSLYIGSPSFEPQSNYGVHVPQWDASYATDLVQVHYTNGTTSTYTAIGSSGLSLNLHTLIGNSDVSVWATQGYPSANMYMYENDGTRITFAHANGNYLNRYSRLGNVVIWGGTTPGPGAPLKLLRYSTSGGAVLAESATVTSGFYNSIAIAGANVYAMEYGGFNIHRFDLATLTLQESIGPPAGFISPGGDWIMADGTTLYLLHNTTLYRRDGSEWTLIISGLQTELEAASSLVFNGRIIDGTFYNVWQVPGFPPIHYEVWSLVMHPVGTPELVDLADIVEAEHLRANAAAADEFDVEELRGKYVTGIAMTGSAREGIETLRAAYYFDATCSDKVYYRMRGRDSVIDVPFIDTGVAENAANDTPFVGPMRENDQEIAAKVHLVYTNLQADYDNGTEQADRMVGDSNRIDLIQLPIVMEPPQAKGIAETIAIDGRVGRMLARAQVSDRYIALEPTDVSTWYDDDGNAFRMRTVEMIYAAGCCQHVLALDDAASLIEVGITAEHYSPTINLPGPATAEMILLDIPILRDGDNDPGLYVAVRGASENYSGAGVFRSTDGTVYSQLATVMEQAVIGTASTVLGDWTGGDVFDETNSVTVDVGISAALSSSTRAAMLLDSGINAIALGADGRWELMQFRDATMLSIGVYTLSGFLRGRRGTEWAMDTHATGDTMVLLRPQGLRRLSTDASDIGITRYWKAVPLGSPVSSVASETFENDAMGLKPYSPVDLRGSRDLDTSDITLTWKRRTRLIDRFGTSLGDSVPLGEDSELYDVEIYADGTYATVERTFASLTSATVDYTAAQQTTDFGSTQSTLYVRVYQRSATVGRGTPLEDVLTWAAYSPPAPLDPYSADVSLLLNGNGTNGSGTFTDLSAQNQTIVLNSTPTWTTAVLDPFGNPSISLGASQCLRIASVASLIMGTDDFTWEGWYRFSGASTVGWVLYNGDNSGFTPRAGIGPGTSGGSAWFYNGSASVAKDSVTPSINTWHYIAYSRNAATGGQLWIGDTPGATCTKCGSTFNDAGVNYPLQLGLGIGGSYSASNLLSAGGAAWLGPIRITKGVDRYPTAPTVPDGPFPI